MATYTGSYNLTEKGKKFIRAVCKGTGTSLLRGINKRGVLPYCDPPQQPNTEWISHAKFNGKPIENNEQLGEALIYWYNYYGDQYKLDANVLAAQAFQESAYRIWIYSEVSSASGIGQFLPAAIYDIILINNYSYIRPKMTQSEIDAILLNTYGKNPDGSAGVYQTTYALSSEMGKQNKPIMHQNIIDNPEIMIKAQFRYMKFIASYGKSALTSQVLFGYSRGIGNIGKTYSDSIALASNSKNYQDEGIEYVFKIFRYLSLPQAINGVNGMYFGYDGLGMEKFPNPDFDHFIADGT